jgi:hypothetical protein
VRLGIGEERLHPLYGGLGLLETLGQQLDVSRQTLPGTVLLLGAKRVVKNGLDIAADALMEADLAT